MTGRTAAATCWSKACGWREPGAHVAIGDHLVIEITDECEPCERMEALHPGLRAAMTPDWRGGFLGRVVEDGEIAVGDEVRIL